jgi:hypothetical protein
MQNRKSYISNYKRKTEQAYDVKINEITKEIEWLKKNLEKCVVQRG